MHMLFETRMSSQLRDIFQSVVFIFHKCLLLAKQPNTNLGPADIKKTTLIKQRGCILLSR